MLENETTLILKEENDEELQVVSMFTEWRMESLLSSPIYIFCIEKSRENSQEHFIQENFRALEHEYKKRETLYHFYVKLETENFFIHFFVICGKYMIH